MKEFLICIGVALLAVAFLLACGYAAGMALITLSRLLGVPMTLMICGIIVVGYVAYMVWDVRRGL